jgi:hypothetical protein
MIIDAVTLAVSDRDGRLVAFAVLCPAARYCSTLAERGSSPTSHFVTPEEWKLIEHQIAAGQPRTPLSSDSPISAVLDDLLDVWRVQWVARTPIRVAGPEDTRAALDQHLATSLQLHRGGLRLQDKAS